MKDKQVKKIMRDQFAPPDSAPMEIPARVEAQIEALSCNGRPTPQRRARLRPAVALCLTFVLLAGMIPVVLFVGTAPHGWRDVVYSNVQNAQFTPNYDLILYDPNKSTAKRALKATAAPASVSPLPAAKPDSADLVPIQAEDILPEGLFGNELTDNEWIDTQTEKSKELALYCVKNIAEPGVWQELEIPGGIYGMFEGGIAAFGQIRTYAMFTVQEDGVTDIYAMSEGEFTGYWRHTEPGEYGFMKKHIVVDPVNDTVETWADQSTAFRREHISYSLCPYIFVKKDSEFTIAYETDYSRYTSDWRSKTTTVVQFSRIGDIYSGVSNTLSFTLDEKSGEDVFTANDMMVFSAEGSNYAKYYIRNGHPVDPAEWQDVYVGASDWSYRFSRVIRVYGSERIEDMDAAIDMIALRGIKTYFADFSPNRYGLYAVREIELYDGTRLDESTLPMLESPTFSSDDPEKMYFITKNRGRFTVNRRYLNEIPCYSRVLGDVPFPAGVGYCEGLDFTPVDRIESVVKTAAILGVENAYTNPDKVLEKLESFYSRGLAFTVVKPS